VQDGHLTTGTLRLVLGSNFTALQPAGSSGSGISGLSATYGGLTANTNICNDSAAFAGPDGSLG
jgi:hypothetical protein